MDHDDPTAVFTYAMDVSERIAGGLRERWYNSQGVSLDIRWSPFPGIGAWAYLVPSLEAPTEHVVTLTYDLVQTIYDLAWTFAFFATGNGKPLPVDAQLIPARFEPKSAAEFMFASGIAFVIFHEIGHLNQGHGSIRSKFNPARSDGLSVHDFDVHVGAPEAPATGEHAAILHATELAADFEALDWMASITQRDFQGEEYTDHAYLQCAIVSCIMLMFNGAYPMRLDPAPIRSHPYPPIRMYLWVKAYSERTAVLLKELKIEADAKSIFTKYSAATFWALMSWVNRIGAADDPAYTDILKGPLEHPNFGSYMRHVVDAWSRVYRDARSSRRYGMPLSVLYFDNDFRALIGTVPNEETLRQHVEAAAIAVRRA